MTCKPHKLCMNYAKWLVYNAITNNRLDLIFHHLETGKKNRQKELTLKLSPGRKPHKDPEGSQKIIVKLRFIIQNKYLTIMFWKILQRTIITSIFVQILEENIKKIEMEKSNFLLKTVDLIFTSLESRHPPRPRI